MLCWKLDIDSNCRWLSPLLHARVSSPRKWESYPIKTYPEATSKCQRHLYRMPVTEENWSKAGVAGGREAPNGTWFRGSRMGWEGSKFIASFLQSIRPHPTTPPPGLLWLMEPASFKAFFFATFLVVFIQWHCWAPATGMHCSGTQVSCCLTNII